MYKLIDLRSGLVVAFTDSHAIAWLLVCQTEWLGMQY